MLLVREDAEKNKIERLAEIFFWFGMFCELVVSFSGYAYGGYKEPIIIVLGMACFCVKILLTAHWKRDLAFFFLLGLYGVACYHFQNSALILRIALILLAGRDMNREKVVKLFFWGTLTVVLVTGILSVLGMHNELYMDGLFRNETERRFCFGFFHPNGFSFFVFRLLAFGLYLYGKQLRLWQSTIIFGATFFLILLSNSKMGIAITLACFIGYCFIKYYKGENRNRIVYYCGNTLFLLELILIMISGFFMKVSYAEMHVENAGLRFLNEMTSGRLAYVSKTFHEYRPTFFGYRDFMEATEVGFVNTLYNEGILFFVLYLIILFWIYRRLYCDNNAWGMLLVLGFSAYSFAEAFIPYVNKNGVWFMLIGIDFISVLLNQWKGRKKHEENQD